MDVLDILLSLPPPPPRLTLDPFLSYYGPLEADLTRLHPSSFLGLWLLLEFCQ